MSTADSQATFGSSIKRAVREKYGNRCAICLTKITVAGSQATHLFDSAGAGAIQLEFATAHGLLLPNYKRSSAENGMVQCASCHLGLFMHNHIALSLPPPILQYIKDYLMATKPADRMPLYKIFRSLIPAAESPIVSLPDIRPILPYLGLYTLVPLKPDELHRLEIPTLLLPDLSIIQGGQFVPAPAGTSPTTSNVARIFDVLAITNSQAMCRPGGIPLSPFHAEFVEHRYWRLPINPEVILSMFMYRVSSLPPRSHCEEIVLTQAIYGILLVSGPGVNIGGPSGPSGSGRGSDSDQEGRKRKSRISWPWKRSQPGQSDVGGSGNVRIAGSQSKDAQDEIDSKTLYSDEEQEQDWEFGPSLSTNQIIFSARGTVLI